MTEPAFTDPIDGRRYTRALSYVLKAVPTDDAGAALQHVTYYGSRLVGSDGMRRHDAHLPAAIDTPIAFTRISAQELLIFLEAAHKYSKRRSGTFSVRHKGTDVHIEYGGRAEIVVPLQRVDVRCFPPDEREWVHEDAPINPEGLGHIDCDHLHELLGWWRSWDKTKGSCLIRGGQDDGPLRVDIVSGGERVVTAFLLPMDHAEAELPGEPTLFDKDRPDLGDSNLALDLSGDGASDEPLIIRIKVGDVEHEFNVTGLDDPDELLVSGPCGHREEGDCPQCTGEKVAAARRLQAAENAAATKPKKRGKKKPDQETMPLDTSADAQDLH